MQVVLSDQRLNSSLTSHDLYLINLPCCPQVSIASPIGLKDFLFERTSPLKIKDEFILLSFSNMYLKLFPGLDSKLRIYSWTAILMVTPGCKHLAFGLYMMRLGHCWAYQELLSYFRVLSAFLLSRKWFPVRSTPQTLFLITSSRSSSSVLGLFGILCCSTTSATTSTVLFVLIW